MDKWETCEHEWEDKIDSQFSNEYVEDVICSRCACSGSRDRVTGIVTWPAT